MSIVGAGGLGKTRLAHVMGRETDLPVVRFVELAGVAAPEDVVGEVASAVGVRDSVSEQRGLTREQRADVRARIARHLAGAPTLLILDNCEHVIDAAAELVAFLVAGVRDLRVLTTTRAPLAIAAERVVPARAARHGGRRRAVPPAGRGGAAVGDAGRRRRRGRSSPTWTGCRWRSSWPRRGCG